MTTKRNRTTDGSFIPLTDRELKQTVKTYIASGENVSETARTFGVSRGTIRHRLDRAADKGFIDADVLKLQNRASHRSFEEAIKAQKSQFNRVEAAGTYRTPHEVPLPDDKPFVLVALGDPHLDNKGTDLGLWDRWIEPLSEENVRGVCLGDMTDNWLRFLGHLYGDAESTESDGWVLVQGYLEKIGADLDALVGGNHDLWKNEYALKYLCEQFDINYRAHGVTLAYTTPMGRKVTIGMRHRFVGHSQWNTVHAITKAASLGWRANVLIGGDKHISGQNWVKDPKDGTVTHCYQLAAFKVCDDYAEEKGFQDQHITPAVALVIDPRYENDDPRLVKTFHDAREAADYCAFLRSGNK